MVPMYGPCMAFARLRSLTTDSVTHGGLLGTPQFFGDRRPCFLRSDPSCPEPPNSFTERAALLRPSTQRHLLAKGALGAVTGLLDWNSPDLGLLQAEKKPMIRSPTPKSGELPHKGVKREQV
ncbi:uncharacterized protein LOC123008157 [Tribolium madens]|uniref:uncharacterized protein LOC123008157 n=1 Tax=Tribolium madens TaxID=41895 RepID=UPI001CF751AA|nr:uncharacterized protein LOC123008157 [Tribolium madens]